MVIKNLKPGWFPFGDYQEPTEDNNFTWQTEEGRRADEWLNKLYQSVADDHFAGKMTLSVNCIVGANGSGKSTILELMLRIINNVSVRLIDEQWMPKNGRHHAQMGHDMTYAVGFAAELFFEVDGVLYSMLSNTYKDYEVKGIKDNSVIMEYLISSDTNQHTPLFKELTPRYKRISTNKLKEVLRKLFYTIYTNYSIYSLNEEDYCAQQLISDNYSKELNGDWIHGLLHKNDGYLAPAVMIPFRDKNGIINIQTEKRLSKQRLSALALLFESQKKTFLDGYKPLKISYTFLKDSENEYKERFMKDSDMIVFLYDSNKENCQNMLWNSLRKAWKEKIVQYAKSYHVLVIQAAVSYLAYKTLKVCMQNRELGAELGLKTREDMDLENDPIYAFQDLFFEEPPKMKIVDDIYEEKELSHVTLKIHQTLEFLHRNVYKVENPETDMGEVVFSSKEMTIKDCIDSNIKYLKDQNVYGEKEIKRFETYDDAMLSLPPSFIEWEISFAKEGESNPITLDSMSSGQKQMLQCFSYIMYHIKNLQSVKEGDYHAKYHHVNLVFDEAELYYHPEFQRSIISNLIKMLSWCHIDGRKIRSINMIIVTHSPFVLSDVPRQNCLFLRDGNVDRPKNETFGANIHDLLFSNFFINDYMGCIARKAVDDIVQLKGEKNKDIKNALLDADDIDYYSYLANTIAEPYIRKQLQEIVEKAIKVTPLEEAKKRQRDLEAQLEAIKKEISKMEMIEK
ncbi:MAG: hypothetical protein ACI4A7_05730 [Prevotella sp.]